MSEGVPLLEPTLDELWQAVAESLAAAEADRLAIYRGGVPAPEALASIAKHISAGLAARVMYERLVNPSPVTSYPMTPDTAREAK